jgi:hypothetical protein
MITTEMVEKLDRLTHLIDIGEFERSFEGTLALLAIVESTQDKGGAYYKMLFNIAGVLTDIGHMQPNSKASRTGLQIMENNQAEIIEQIEEDAFYYNLSNAKSNAIEEKNPFNQSFETIEQLIELKSYFWKTIKFSHKNKGSSPPEYTVNLGNALKQQFRIVEALKCYDDVNLLGLNIPQSWINRSASLILLNRMSNTYSIQMLQQIKEGYENVITSDQIPPLWIEHHKEQIGFHSQKIDEACNEAEIDQDLYDHETTLKEYEELSDFRRFCLDKHLALSEHGLYCKCAGSARDDLTIPTLSGVAGDFVVPMEMVLNRLKSEFSFSRRLYYEYLTHETENELQHESCFSELFNDELLGLDVEKLRTSFRLCFGILDKIGVAICKLYNLYPPNGQVYFQSFWQLDREDRRERFESVKNPGLLALYSIATDLNDKKDGEWAFFKQCRNDLEHKFIVIHKSDEPSDIYSSYSFMDGIIFMKEVDFIQHLEQLFQITRSAIFSFVFTVRDKAIQTKKDDGL